MAPRVAALIQPLRDIRQLRAEFRLSHRLVETIERMTPHIDIPTGEGGSVAFVILPWPTFTLLPEYTVALAMGFGFRGRKITLIWDDTPFGHSSIAQRLQQRRINQLLQGVQAQAAILRLSHYTPSEGPALSHPELEALVEQNAIQHFRTETMPPQAPEYLDAVRTTMSETARRIERLFGNHAFEYVVVPGGVYRTSGLFVKLGKRLGIRVATFDSDGPVALVSTSGVAAQLDDIPRALEALPQSETVAEEAQTELRRRMSGRDIFSYQQVSANGTEWGGGVLLALNQSFDTAALGRHCVFKNQTEWMLESVAWLLEHSSEDIVIRRHPVEAKRPSMHSKDDYEGLLTARFGDTSRIRFVRAEDPVNTYDLLAGARAVLTHTSTVGVEAAAMGKPVVTQSSSYYAKLGFVWHGHTLEEYFTLLAAAVAGNLEVSEQQRHIAWRCYFLTQRCNFLPTRITPVNFRQWTGEGLEAILQSEDFDLLFTAIDLNRPLSLEHAKRFGLG